MKMSFSALLCAACLFGVDANAATITQDFDAPGAAFVGQKLPSPAFNTFFQNAAPAPTVLAADANSDGQFLQLKDGTRNVYTNAGFEAAGSEAYNRIQGSFDFRMTCLGNRTGFGNGGCADGFAFSFLDTDLYGSSGQADALSEGVVAINEFSTIVDYDQPLSQYVRSGLTIGLNIFEPSGLREGAFYVGSGDVADPLFIENQDVDMVTGLQSVRGRFMTMVFDMNFGTDLLSLAVEDGANTYQIFSDLDISGLGFDAYNSRLAFGTRSGDAGLFVDVDNINVSFTPAAVSSVPLPASLWFLIFGLGAIGVNRFRAPSNLAS